MEPMYLEDLPAGLHVTTARRTLTESDIMTFAGVSGDFNPLHTDEDFVKEHTPFRGRIAHGLLVLAMSSGLRSSVQKPMLVEVANVRSGASASRSLATLPSRIQQEMPLRSFSPASLCEELSWQEEAPDAA